MPSALERVLDRLQGGRSLPAGMLLVAICTVLATFRCGHVVLAVLLAVLGGWLRATRLDLPLAIDGEVQRMFTGHLPLLDALRFSAFNERHPPLLFMLLHVAQMFGQSEAIVRLPAVIAGIMIGPAVVATAHVLRARFPDRGTMFAATALACAGVAATAAPELVSRSREVSELTLFGLFAVVTLGASLHACRASTVIGLALVTVGHAALLWTYYMAPFLLVGFWVTMRLLGQVPRRVILAAALGVVLGAPNLLFAAISFLQDLPTRQLAEKFPSLVWGDRSALMMAQYVGGMALNTFGTPLGTVVALAGLGALVHRDRLVLAPLAAVAAVGLGMVMLTPVARIQPYYFVCALPLLPLALGVTPSPPAGARRVLATAAIALATAWSIPHALTLEMDRIYAPHPHASGRRFAQIIATRPESQVAVLAPGYERRIAYSLALIAGLEIDWRDVPLGQEGSAPRGLRQTFVPLLGGDDAFDASKAIEALEALSRQAPFLAALPVTSMPEIDRWVDRCTELDRTVAERLLHCPKRADRAP